MADALVAKVLPQVQQLSVGMPEDDCDITPVISDSSANFIEGLVKDAREKGEKSRGEKGENFLFWQHKCGKCTINTPIETCWPP